MDNDLPPFYVPSLHPRVFLLAMGGLKMAVVIV